jgi:RNA polymerase sigma-70 factor (sigma-E family)
MISTYVALQADAENRDIGTSQPRPPPITATYLAPDEIAADPEQTRDRLRRYTYVESEITRPDPGASAQGQAQPGGSRPDGDPDTDGAPGEHDAAAIVTALYQGHALALIRLAYIMLADRQAAEDVVQDAFCGLYRAWPRLPDHGNPLAYVRASVVNGCRTVHRQARRVRAPLPEPDAASAESVAMAGEEQRATVAALNRLPPRQREAIVLRFYACLAEQDVAQAMGVSRGTVKSTTARGLAALGRILREELQ